MRKTILSLCLILAALVMGGCVESLSHAPEYDRNGFHSSNPSLQISFTEPMLPIPAENFSARGADAQYMTSGVSERVRGYPFIHAMDGSVDYFLYVEVRTLPSPWIYYAFNKDSCGDGLFYHLAEFSGNTYKSCAHIRHFGPDSVENAHLAKSTESRLRGNYVSVMYTRLISPNKKIVFYYGQSISDEYPKETWVSGALSQGQIREMRGVFAKFKERFDFPDG